MATFHCSIKAVGRATGRSSVAAAAYRAGEVMRDERTGLTHHYGERRGVEASFIIAPENAPAWAQNRSELWNAVEAKTAALNGRLATELELALPHELTAAQRRELAEGFARDLSDRYKVAVDVAIHAPGKGGDHRNHHAHIMMTHREIGQEGFGEICNARVIERKVKGQIKPVKVAGINPEDTTALRKLWGGVVNRAYEAAGLDIRVDHRSHKDRGMIEEPTKHLGPAASAMERRGERSDRGDINRAISGRNTELERIENERLTVREAIAELQAERQARAEHNELRAAVRSASSDRILEAMTEKRATFSRDELIRELGRVVTDRKEAKALATELLAHPDIVGLRETADGPVTRYTTRAVLSAEREVLRTARLLSDKAGPGLTVRERNVVIGHHKHLDEEQRAAFEQLTSGRGLTILAGEAGTGKSTTLAAVRDAYERAGYRVVGSSWTNSVVQDMAADGFKETTTLKSAFYEAKRTDWNNPWDKKTVLVVDEAAMLSSQSLGRFLDLARQKGARVILAGDDKQLASIERGGLFGALVTEHGAAELHTVYRVQDGDQKRAFNAMHKGRFGEALEIFDKAGAIKWTETQEESRAALVAKWKHDSAQAPDKSRFVFAYANKDVDALNADIRQVRRERGELGEDHEFKTGNGEAKFAKGDRVQFTASAALKADKAQGLVNAGMGTIKEIEGRRVTVKLDGKGKAREVTFTVGEDKQAGEFNAFRHGYAGTIYKGQGKTLDQSYLYHSENWRSASTYVALSRHREQTSLFVAREVTRGREPWTMQTGGYDALDKGHKAKAEADYEAWAEENPKAASKYGLAEYVDYRQGKHAERGRSEFDLAQLTRQIGRADETRSASQFIPSETSPPEVTLHTLAGPNRTAAMEKEAKTMAQRVEDRLAGMEISEPAKVQGDHPQPWGAVNPMTDNPMAAARRAVWGEEQEKASQALWGRYQQIKQEWTAPRQELNREAVGARFKAITTELKKEREQVAKRTEPGTQARIVGDAAAVFRAMEKRDKLADALETHRLTRDPPAWRAWVQDQAERGDKTAQVEMRRWQAPAPHKAGERSQAQASQPGRYGGLTDGVEMRARNFRGGVEYRINGKVAVIDNGNVIKTVDKGREAPQAIALSVSLQAAKRGGHVKIDGSRAYKDRVADIAATRGLSVKFEDRKMQARYAGRLAQVRPGMKPPPPQSSLLKGGWFAHLLTPAPVQPSRLPPLSPDLKPAPITPGQLNALRGREQQRIEKELSR